MKRARPAAVLLDTGTFFDRDPALVAKDLLGKVLRARWKGDPAATTHSPPSSSQQKRRKEEENDEKSSPSTIIEREKETPRLQQEEGEVEEEPLWLSAMIVETEAYYKEGDKASHSSLGFTERRRALWMDPGTIYMYYSRAGDSMNVSCKGQGNAVLIKAGVPYLEDLDQEAAQRMLRHMRTLNPITSRGRRRGPATGTARERPQTRLCAGQTLLCRSLGLKVEDWNARSFDPAALRLEDVGYRPTCIQETTRLGISLGRDHHLPLRFLDENFVESSTLPKAQSKNK
ncbi:putative 3-methyladenine DNA glycosylase [Balamuthia mandrillaris]